MIRTTLGIGALAIAALLSACSAMASTNTTSLTAGDAAGTPAVMSTPVASSTPQQMAATSAPQSAAAPTSLDPCQLVTSQEASSLAGTSYGAGREETTPGGGKICIYGYQTTNVFTVEVAQAPDVATAQAAKAQFLADLQSKLQQVANEGLNVTQLPNFADGAVFAQANISLGGQTISGSSIGVLKGTIFFGFSDLVVGHGAPSSSAMQSQAQTVLGRL
jgi:hypothetical protein